ncbi:hypothetical protein Ancab_039088 [Ancistrocladus abbreviatus]
MASQMPRLTAPVRPSQPRSDRDAYPTPDGQGPLTATTMAMPSGTMGAVPTATTTTMPMGPATATMPMGTAATAMPMGTTTTAMPRGTTTTMATGTSMAMTQPASLTAPIGPLPPRGTQVGMFLTSDDQVLTRRVEETHVPDGSRQIDVRPLFQIVEDVLNRATQTIAQGTLMGTQMATETMEGKASSTLLVSTPDLPIIIDRVSCEILCKCWAGGDAHEATLSVLRLLAHFPWEAKVVLTLAAFGMTYGEFWLLAQIYPTNPLAKSMALLKQLPIIVEQSGSYKFQFEAINKLIKAILNVTRCIIDFKELPALYLTEEEPQLRAARSYFPVAVYWTIRSTVGAAAHITTITSRGFEHLPASNITWELSNWEFKLNSIYEHLMGTMKILLDLIEKRREESDFEMLRKFIYEMIHVDNMPVLKRLIGGKDDPQPLFDCANKRRVHFEVLRRKSVILLISDMTISQNELSMLVQIYNATKIHQYEIVWMPIIDRSITWTDTLQTQFERLQSPMQWYSVYRPTQIDSAVTRFTREIWNFSGRPILVVLDPQGRVLSPNAAHMVWIWGSAAFPFTSLQEEALWKLETWKLELLVDSIDQTITDWIRDGKYIFVFGGDDIDWLRNFIRQARSVADSAGIDLKMLYVGKSHAKRDAVSKVTAALMADDKCHCWPEPTTVWFFWQRIESMLLSKMQLEQADNHADIITQEIKKLLSYDRGPGGWALLSKGSTVLLLGHGSTVYEALRQHETIWRKEVPLVGFDNAFRTHLVTFDIPSAPSSRFDFPLATGRIPPGMLCPRCHFPMENTSLTSAAMRKPYLRPP